jgi:hypothetical protein
MESGYIKRILCLIVYGFCIGGFLLLGPIYLIVPIDDDSYPYAVRQLSVIPFIAAFALGAVWGLICGVMLEKFRNLHLRLQYRPVWHRLSIVLLIQTGLLTPLWFTAFTVDRHSVTLEKFVFGFVAFFVATSVVTSGIAYLFACLWRYLYPFEKRKVEDYERAKS